MKKTLYAITVLICIIIVLDSCVSSKESTGKPDNEYLKNDAGLCFVQMNDGTTMYYANLKLVTGILKTPYLLADRTVKINANDIKAYQDATHYAVSQKTFCCGRLSYIAKGTLPGFAVRVIKGNLNVYVKKYINGPQVVDEYFLQSGTDGKIFAYSTETMQDLVKNNKEAYNYFNSFTNKKTKKNMPKRLLVTADLYNNGQLNAKN